MIRCWIIAFPTCAGILWFGAACRPSGAAGDEGGGKGDEVATQTEHKYTNSLIKATSPYLLQHAHNPVDWYEWGPEALEKAKKEDKPIFLSIGYSACHWCHVMEHECFEREEVADILNANFISIKVDREERPDIDEIYMQATVTMTGHGGWPMSLFVTPEGIPFYAGTYFPRVQFIRILNQIDGAWRQQRESILEQGDKINAHLQKWAAAASGGQDLIAFETVSRTANRMVRYFDRSDGGISGGGTNKFPPSMAMELMLREYIRSGESKLLAPVELTLTKMARGGIYDHLAGGICRYSTDTKWLVPHFEKMLYDQALVSSIYIDGYLVTKDRLFADTARGIFDYVIRDLQSPQGGFYSTRDADSEGMEGKFYIWTVEQVTEVLGQDDAKLFCTYYDVTSRGNWFESRGHAPAGPKNILNIQRDLAAVAKDLGLEPGDLDKRLAKMRIKMFEARAKRVPPGLDDKILTGWNGLMIASLAKGGRVFDEPKYTNAAARAADFIFKELRRDGHLLRTYRKGHARLTGYLTDYAYFIEGLLNLYEATFDVRWLNEAVALNDDLIRRYFDTEGGGFFFTASDGETLIARSKDPNDGAVPSGNSVQAMNLLRLALLVDNKDYKAKAESIFRAFASLVKRSPTQFERLLCAVDFYGGRPKEIAIIGKLDGAQTRAMLGTVFGRFQPNRIVALADGDSAPPELVKRIPLLKGKSRIDGKTTAYVCENYACQRPVTTAAELAKQLAR